MKTAKLIASALLSAGLFFGVNAFAQENEGKGGFFDNSFVTIAGGVNYSVPKIAKTNTWGGLGIATELQFGKWWNPYVGTSIGWHGATGKAIVDLGVPAGKPYGLNFFNVNLLWDFNNTFAGAKDRIWSLVPHADAGALLQGGDGTFFGYGGGIQNLWKLSEKVKLSFDVRAIIYKHGPHDIYNTVSCCYLMYPSVTLGVSINLGKKAKKPTPTVVPVTPPTDGPVTPVLPTTEDKPVVDETPAPVPVPEETTPVVEPTPAPVPVMDYLNIYFDLNKSVVTPIYQKTIQEFVEKNPGKKFVLSGYADKQTGNTAVNQRISEKRVEAVASCLRKFGVPAGDIATAAYGDTTQPFPVQDKNRVVMIVAK